VAASYHAVSRVLVWEKEEGSKVIQRPIYYISKALSGAKLNYIEIKKIAYAVLISSRKLKHYFQAHEIKVPSSQSLRDVFNNKEASRRIEKWAIELSQFEISYVPRTTVKSQALADFVANWTPLTHQNPQPQTQIWMLYTDGAWGHLGAEASTILVAPSDLHTKYAARLEFKIINNIAEYEGLILGLNKAKALGAKIVLAKIDSQVVVGQVEKEYVTREPELAKYLAIVRALERRFQGFTLKYIPRAENIEADELVKAAATNTLSRRNFLPNTTSTRNSNNPKAFKTIMITKAEDWRHLIVDYLNNIHHPEDEVSTTRIAATARSYILMDGVLYKKGVVQLLLKCITQSEGRELL
jgi:ribonuclease HI